MPFGYRIVRHLATVLHEAGHALVAALVGRKLRGIRVHADISGLTVSKGRPDGPGMVATLLAGYPAPAVVGLAGAWLISHGYAAGTMWALVVVCALLLLLIRNLYGLWVDLVIGAGVAVLSWTATPQMLSVAAYFMVSALLLVAPRAVVELQRSRHHRSRTDADQLTDITPSPAYLWLVIFCLLLVASFFVGGHFLAAHCGLFGRWRLAAAVGRVIISGRTRARPVLTGLCSDIRYRLGCRITLE